MDQLWTACDVRSVSSSSSTMTRSMRSQGRGFTFRLIGDQEVSGIFEAPLKSLPAQRSPAGCTQRRRNRFRAASSCFTTTMSARRQASTTSLSRYARAGSPDFTNRSLDFCNAFWGAGDGGVNVLFARMRGAMRTMEELKAFWKER